MGARSGRAHRRSAASGGAVRRALAFAFAFAAVLLLGLVAPLAAAFSVDASPLACCRGRCCCNGSPPSDEPCLRAACHCEGDRHAFPPVLVLPDVVLTRQPSLATLTPAAALGLAPPDAARALARPVPHPPPRPDAEAPPAF